MVFKAAIFMEYLTYNLKFKIHQYNSCYTKPVKMTHRWERLSFATLQGHCVKLDKVTMSLRQRVTIPGILQSPQEFRNYQKMAR